MSAKATEKQYWILKFTKCCDIGCQKWLVISFHQQLHCFQLVHCIMLSNNFVSAYCCPQLC